jgi:colanic acid/amylovoran biosynthesis glycosyltransferase
MKSSRRLYYFTNNYPFGLGESWKTNELKVLVDYFEKIDLIPFSYPSAGNKLSVSPIEGVEYHLPILAKGVSQKHTLIKFLEIIFSLHSLYFLKEFFRNKLFLSKLRAIRWVGASYKALQLKKSIKLNKLFNNAPQDAIFYFFWGRETAEVLPLCKVGPNTKRVVRFHGYDLYREVNDGYLPFQDSLMDNIDLGLVCSQYGLNTLCGYYPQHKQKLLLSRLGVITNGGAGESQDGVFRIVTCSRVVNLKRLHLIPEILKLLDIEVEWIHIGDGPGLKDLKQQTEELKKENIKYQLLGHLTPIEVSKFYSHQSVDLFMNVSESEGVPVSVMEALSAGIPVIATNVGGTSELIDENVGFLLEKDFMPSAAAELIVDFVKKTKVEKNVYRFNAFSKYDSMCKADKLAENLAHLLLT